MRRDMQTIQKEIKSNLDKMEQHIAQNIIVNVSQQLQTLRGDLDIKFDEINIKISELEERVQTLEAINIQLQNTVRNKEKLSKIIVKGLKNDKEETNDICDSDCHASYPRCL